MKNEKLLWPLTANALFILPDARIFCAYVNSGAKYDFTEYAFRQTRAFAAYLNNTKMYTYLHMYKCFALK